jgi:Flp pilus assembly protein TadD
MRARSQLAMAVSASETDGAPAFGHLAEARLEWLLGRSAEAEAAVQRAESLLIPPPTAVADLGWLLDRTRRPVRGS